MENEVRDRPAERGLTINNILLGLVLVGGAVFGTIITNIMSDIQTSVKELQQTMGNMRISNGVINNEILHMKSSIAKIDDRVKILESGENQ